MIGKGEVHSMAYDKVQDSTQKLMNTPTYENMVLMIRAVSRYGNVLSERDLERISKSCIKEMKKT